MVSAAQRLRQQQQSLRAGGARVPLQLQQEALRKGISPQRILIQREQKRVEREITQSQKEQALIAEGVLRQAGNVQQLAELLKTVPPEIRRFITVTPEKAKQDISKNISQVQGRIQSQQKLLDSLVENRKRAQKAGNQQRASDIQAQISGVQKEVRFLKGTIPQLEKGSLIPFSEIKSVGSDVRFGEEERRIALEKQFAPLASKLEGGRQELSKIFRERKITIEQQKQLGLIKESKVPITTVEKGRELSDFEKLLAAQPSDFDKLTGIDFSKITMGKKPEINLKDVDKFILGGREIDATRLTTKQKKILLEQGATIKEIPIGGEIGAAPFGAVTLSKITDPFRGLFPSEGLKEIGAGFGELAGITFGAGTEIAKDIGKQKEIKKIEEKFKEISPELFAPTFSEEFELPGGTRLDIGK